MLKKSLVILLLLNLFQILVSCDRNCTTGPNIEIQYSDLIVLPHAEVDDEIDVLGDSVLKEDFLLTISFDEAETQSTDLFSPSYFGYNSSLALDCGPTYIYPNQVKNINIKQINADSTDQQVDATEYFGEETPTGYFSVQELIGIFTENDFRISMNLSIIADDSLIYENAYFDVVAELASGTIFSKRTKKIDFHFE